ncbi:hypothetical protein [Allokutzneria sp. NRRL B-24872]|uniref:hypothetical protein n=1 Tax=Allokutzneria sp. NRRL B-24872 TaxID=1137961 RepID=UPI001177BAAC|nr:hypothetical protein [Allokutzneria sp. NRRL B-24872]
MYSSSQPPTVPPGPPVMGRTSLVKCLLAGLVWFGAALVIVGIALGFPSPEVAGGVTARLLLPGLLAGLVAWLFLRRRSSTFVLRCVVALPGYVVLALLFGALRIVNET